LGINAIFIAGELGMYITVPYNILVLRADEEVIGVVV
jgi:hypothetical protein